MSQDSKVYIGNLNYETKEADIQDLLSEYTVKSVNLFSDKGFGFIEFSTPEEADKVIKDLNGVKFLGRSLRIDKARPKR